MSLTVSDQRAARKAGPTSADAGSAARPPRERGRSVPTLYGAVTLVLVAGALTFALSTPPPSTPPLAAVAPAPQDRIEVERVEQSSRFGEGAGDADGECVAGEEGCAGVGEEQPAGIDPTGPPIVEESSAPASLRQCVRGPGGLRQTADPQSPPCKVEIFDGDNGGATAPGVTATTIRVGVPWPLDGYFTHAQGNNTEDDRRVVAAFAAHVNEEYELYQRSIELVYVDRQTDSGPAADRAYAEEVAAHDLFAMLGLGASSTKLLALAGHGIVALEPGRSPRGDADVYQPGGGLVWGLFPSTEQALAATGDFACTALAGRPPRHGGEEVAGATRHFGVVSQRGSSRVDATVLVRRLEACEAPLLERGYDRDGDDPEQLLRSFREAGVTTVVCACNLNIKELTREAAEIRWEPEWLLPGFAGVAELEQVAQVDPSQRHHVFGLVPDLRELTDTAVRGQASLKLEERYWSHALRDEDPAFNFTRLDRGAVRMAYDLYAQLLVLGSGIQWAGPELTPASFVRALEGVRYPNPDVGSPRWFQPAVGFGSVDRTFNSDFALAWWSQSEDAETTGEKGRFCYVGDGRRFTAGGFPADADELLFDPEAGCS